MGEGLSPVPLMWRYSPVCSVGNMYPALLRALEEAEGGAKGRLQR
jgi:hypothetical protein